MGIRVSMSTELSISVGTGFLGAAVLLREAPSIALSLFRRSMGGGGACNVEAEGKAYCCVHSYVRSETAPEGLIDAFALPLLLAVCWGDVVERGGDAAPDEPLRGALKTFIGGGGS